MNHAAADEDGGRATSRAYLSPDDCVRRSGLGLRTIARAIAAGRLRSFKVGARRLVAVADLEAWIRAGTEAEYPR